MRVVDPLVKLYFKHTDLTPDNVRFSDTTILMPEVGDVLTGEFGWMGANIRTSVVKVTPTGGISLDGNICYDVILTGTEPA